MIGSNPSLTGCGWLGPVQVLPDVVGWVQFKSYRMWLVGSNSSLTGCGWLGTIQVLPDVVDRVQFKSYRM